ncbi:vif protein [Simian immunodeficiency virus]|uniref:Vif protein n=1 Tax=Simian immunodeficiency virus TaxID=11723 RepID=V5T9T5_SIV|nr:vif protein [Simian immunodeficiency virus]
MEQTKEWSVRICYPMGRKNQEKLRLWIKKNFPECTYHYKGKTESPEWWTEGRIVIRLGDSIKLTVIMLWHLSTDRFHRGSAVSYELQIGKWETDLTWQLAVGYMHIIRGKCVEIQEEARRALKGLPWCPCDFQVGHLGVLTLQELCLNAIDENKPLRTRPEKGITPGYRSR